MIIFGMNACVIFGDNDIYSLSETLLAKHYYL